MQILNYLFVINAKHMPIAAGPVGSFVMHKSNHQ